LIYKAVLKIQTLQGKGASKDISQGKLFLDLLLKEPPVSGFGHSNRVD